MRVFCLQTARAANKSVLPIGSRSRHSPSLTLGASWLTTDRASCKQVGASHWLALSPTRLAYAEPLLAHTDRKFDVNLLLFQYETADY